ncbi:MAG: phosphotransferase [Rhodobacteraceae bacterium]|nr:phosphotransferase [Paracoccaceae bacterium]
MDPIERTAALGCFRAPEEIEMLGGGITNINLKVTDGGRAFVVRLGADIPEHGVMRWNELALSRAAEAAGVSPAVVHHEPGVLVLEFIAARTYGEADVRDPANLPRIVDLVARVHRGLGPHLTTPVLAFWPFQVVRSYATRLAADGSVHAAAVPRLMDDAAELQAATGPVDIVIGHNDLLAANILDDGQRLWLIDWEYGGFNTPLFDLAGLAGNNGLSEVQERAMLEQYFEAPAEARWRPYQAMKCVSLMRETLWSMTSEIHSELDFDYAAYTAENMARLDAALADFRNS